jgi:hypothetical protein
MPILSYLYPRCNADPGSSLARRDDDVCTRSL